MNNFLRLIITIFAVLGLALLAVALSPLILGVTLLVGGVLTVLVVLYCVAAAIMFFWYLARNDVYQADNTEFSLEQGKEVNKKK